MPRSHQAPRLTRAARIVVRSGTPVCGVTLGGRRRSGQAACGIPGEFSIENVAKTGRRRLGRTASQAWGAEPAGTAPDPGCFQSNRRWWEKTHRLSRMKAGLLVSFSSAEATISENHTCLRLDRASTGGLSAGTVLTNQPMAPATESLKLTVHLKVYLCKTGRAEWYCGC